MIRPLLAALVLLLGCATAFATVRVKDIADLAGMRENQLLGYGLVVGLPGTGDSLRNAPFTEQAMKSMLEHLGVNIRDKSSDVRNVAAVIVTADVPAFARAGQALDVSVSALGDAISLNGGTLVMTTLLGADGAVYAAAQGALVTSGLAAEGDAQTVAEGIPTVARIPNGAWLERDMPGGLPETGPVELTLANPDFSTAVRVADAINQTASASWGKNVAVARDHRAIRLTKPASVSMPAFLDRIGNVAVEPDGRARVIIDERTGTVVIGDRVRVSRVAITHGNIAIRVSEMPEIIQPNPFSLGETAEQSFTDIQVGEAGDQVAIMSGTTLDVLVESLNQLGVKPRGVIAILQALKSAGALHAERYCRNIADAARDAKFEWQVQTIGTLEDALSERIAELEARKAEVETWLERRERFMALAEGNLVEIYGKMRADAAADQMSLLSATKAAALLLKLNPRVASQILNEMETERAALLSAIMIEAGTADPADKPAEEDA